MNNDFVFPNIWNILSTKLYFQRITIRGFKKPEAQ